MSEPANTTESIYIAREKERRWLLWAMKTRPLTQDEWARVQSEDYMLCIEFNPHGMSRSYNEQDKKREFNDLIYQQLRITKLMEKDKTDD